MPSRRNRPAIVKREEYPEGQGERLSRLEKSVGDIRDLMKYSVQPTLGAVSKYLQYQCDDAGHTRYDISTLVKILVQYDAEKNQDTPAISANSEWSGLLQTAETDIKRMRAAFRDLGKRLEIYIELMRDLKEIHRVAKSAGNKYLRRAVLTVCDSLAGIYSENLEGRHLLAVAEALGQLSDPDFTQDRLRDLDRLLRRAGFETVPSDRSARSQQELARVQA